MRTNIFLLAAILALAAAALTGCAAYPAGSPEMIFSVEFGAARALPIGEASGTAAGVDMYDDANSYVSDGTVTVRAGGPQILIYHTHTTEAYRQAAEGEYSESDAWRTENNEKNIVAVGEALRQELTYKYGFEVLHDTTDHEPPKLATSYSRSVVTMERYAEQYPSLKVFIDLHRDAADVEEDRDDVVVIDGLRCARVMCVVGMGTSNGTKNLEKPYFEHNYAFAERFCSLLDEIDDSFTRTIRVKAGRYNQHISDACLLIEVGHNANTLAEALNSTPFIASALSQCIRVE